MNRFLNIFVVSLVFTLPFANARGDDSSSDDGDIDDEEAYAPVDPQPEDANQMLDLAAHKILARKAPPQPTLPLPQPIAAQAAQVINQLAAAAHVINSGPQPLSHSHLIQQASHTASAPASAPTGLAAPPPAPAAQPDHVVAQNAAATAQKAAAVANKVAKHSVHVIGHSRKALKSALGALHDARVSSAKMDKKQKDSLKNAEASLREATKKAEYGNLKKAKLQKHLDEKKGVNEKEQMLREIAELRDELKEKNIDDKDIEKALDELEADIKKEDGPVNDESKAELERLRQLVDSLDKVEDEEEEKKEEAKIKEEEEEAQIVPVADEGLSTPVEEKGIDIDTQMPYGDLEPFGREDTAQELTESSIKESDEMVDQLERAEVAEEKRAVFRALTRLRGAAITSFDGVARSQTGNIDEYNKVKKWRNSHPLHHLADEESDVSKWAFPDNAD